jgi:hypothetical protein
MSFPLVFLFVVRGVARANLAPFNDEQTFEAEWQMKAMQFFSSPTCPI